MTSRGPLTAALVLATSLPILVSLVVAVSRNGGRAPSGDFALMDLQVHQAMRWRLSVGVYDRYGWHHPGPVYLYLISMVERITGTSGSTAQLLTAAGVNLVCCGLIVHLMIRTFGVRSGVAATAALLLCLAALGSAVLSNPWTPDVVVLPLVLFLVVASLTMSGWLPGVSYCFLVGTFAVQTDLSTIPLVVVVGGVACAAGLFRLARRPNDGDLHLAIALPVLAVALLVWVPPLVQQIDGHPGNLSRIWTFFAASHVHPTLAFAVALAGTAGAAALGLPSPALRLDGSPGQYEFALLAALVVAVALAAALIRRSLLPLVVAAGLGLCAAVLGASRLIGLPWEYLLTWTTAPVIVVVIAVALVLSSIPGRAAMALLGLLCCAGLVLAASRAVQQSPQLASWDATVASSAVTQNIPPGRTVGLIGYDLGPLLNLDGVADYLSSRGRPFDVPAAYRFEFPSLAAPPSYWAVLASNPGEVPRGFRLVAHTLDLYVAIGTTTPPGWS